MSSSRARAKDVAAQRSAVEVLRSFDPDVYVEPFTLSGDHYVALFRFVSSGNRKLRDIEARVGNGAWISDAVATTENSSGLYLWINKNRVLEFETSRAALLFVGYVLVLLGFSLIGVRNARDFMLD